MSISQERADREMQRLKIELLFREHPLTLIDCEILKAITPHYQQRISECRKLKMDIRNVPRFLARDDGSLKRLDGNYKFHPIAGAREGTSPSPERWPVPDAPYEETWRLT